MAGPPQVLLGYPPAVQTHHHVHPLQHLHVVVDLKGVVKVEEVLHLVVGYGALDNSLLARVHYDERQLNGGVGGGGPASPLRLLVALHQVFESNLLKDEILELLGFCLDSLYSLRLDNKEGIYLTVSVKLQCRKDCTLGWVNFSELEITVSGSCKMSKKTKLTIFNFF